MARINNVELIVEAIRKANLEGSDKEIVHISDLVMLANRMNEQSKTIEMFQHEIQKLKAKLSAQTVDYLLSMGKPVRELGDRLDTKA